MLKAVIIGAGHIGQRHYQVIQANPHWSFVGWIDPRSRVGDEPYYPSLAHYLDFSSDQPEQKADVAVIASPNGWHAEQAATCLDAGMSVILEKPIAIDQKGIDLLQPYLKTHAQDICCVMQLRFSPLVQQLQSVLQAKALGDIHQIDVRMYWNRDTRYYQPDGMIHPWRGTLSGDGGALYTQFAHFIDLLYHLFGTWSIKYASTANVAHGDMIEIEDYGIGHFTLGDIEGSLRFTTASYDCNFESMITLLGSEGTLAIGGQYFKDVHYAHPQALHDHFIDEKEAQEIGHARLYSELHKTWGLGEGPVPHTLEEGLDVVQMIMAYYEAASRAT